MKISRYIDHTLLRADAALSEIQKLCSEADLYGFYAVCVNSSRVEDCVRELSRMKSEVSVASVVGFPLGAMTSAAKARETELAIECGANEIDMVINLGWLKDQNYDAVRKDISKVREASRGKILKVIIETCYLNTEEKKIMSHLVAESGADFIKTSTGFGTGGATLEDIALMKEVVGDALRIKASGGIRDFQTTMKYIEAGVTRIGTSNGVQIIHGQTGLSDKY